MFTFKLDYNKPLYEQIKFLMKNWDKLTKYINRKDDDHVLYLSSIEYSLEFFYSSYIEQIKANKLICYKQLEHDILNRLKNLDNFIVSEEEKDYAKWMKKLIELNNLIDNEDFIFSNSESVSLSSDKNCIIFDNDEIEDSEKMKIDLEFSNKKPDSYRFKDNIFIIDD